MMNVQLYDNNKVRINAPYVWKYSSFNKFVQNGHYEQDWCNFEDIYNIKELDYE